MRDKQEVVARYNELRERHLKERSEQYLSRMPINCSYNTRLRVKGKGQLGFCKNPMILEKCGNQRMFICNENSTAQRCRVFCCKNTSESITEEFNSILSSPSRCGNEFPKLAMLIWFLQDNNSSTGQFKRLSKPEKIFWIIRKLPIFRWF